MPFNESLKNEILGYVYGHLPPEHWYDSHFFPFITDTVLRNRLITEYKNTRIIYKLFEGLQASDELLLAQIKTQVIMYVSIQEAVINYVLFDLYESSSPVQSLLFQERLTNFCIPKHKMDKITHCFEHDGKQVLTYYKETKPVDRTKIRYEHKIQACRTLNLMDGALADDLVKLYEYRNTIHIEAEIKKNLDYNLEMGSLAFWRVEGLSMQLSETVQNR